MVMEKHEICLGMAVEFDPDDELRRVWVEVKGPRDNVSHQGRRWQSHREYFGWPRREHEKDGGIVVGTRTLQEGYSEHSYEEPSAWVQTGTIDVVLVAVNLRHEPKKFLARDLTEAF
jgi:hypothetical protein